MTPTRLAFLHDLLMAALSFVISLYLRVGDLTWWYLQNYLWPAFFLFMAVAACVFLWMRTGRGVWRHIAMVDLLTLAKAVTLVMLIFLPVLFFFTRLDQLPRSMLVINWFVLTALLGGPRILYRLLKDRRLDLSLAKAGHRRVPVLLVGAGDGAEIFIRAMQYEPQAHYQVVGIVDEKGTRVGRDILGVPVLGGPAELAEIVERCAKRSRRPERLILTKDNLEAELMRDLFARADALGLTLARVPRMTDLRSEFSDTLETRPIAIEDLLGRPQTVLDRASMKRDDRRPPRPRDGRGRHHRRRAGAPDRSTAHRRTWPSSTTANTTLYRIEQELGEEHPLLSHSTAPRRRARRGAHRPGSSSRRSRSSSFTQRP